MAQYDAPRRRHLTANLKSAAATAAIVGAIGGWVAFGARSAPTTVATAPDPAPAAGSGTATGPIAGQDQPSWLPSGGTTTGPSTDQSQPGLGEPSWQPPARGRQPDSQRAPIGRTRSSR